MVCTSLGSLLRPLFYFLCYIHFSRSVQALFQTHRREELSDDAVKLIEFSSDITKPNETFTAFLFGDRSKECNVTLTRDQLYKNRYSRKIDSRRLLSRAEDLFSY